jgi:hypothetical protein
MLVGRKGQRQLEVGEGKAEGNKIFKKKLREK